MTVLEAPRVTGPVAALGARLRSEAWTVGVWLLLVGVVAWYATIIPEFGAFQVSSILKNSLPLVFLAIGQAVIVIAGGLGHAGPAGHRGEFKRIIASGGALVSTYPAWVKPAVWSFLERNQVLAALSAQVGL